MMSGLLQKLLFTKKGLIALVSIASLIGIGIAAALGRYDWAMFAAGLLITVLGLGGRATLNIGPGAEFFTFVAGAGVMLMALPLIITTFLRCALP